MAEAFGIMGVFVNGAKLEVQPGGSLKLGGMINMQQIAGASVHRSRKMEPTEIRVKVSLLRGQTLTDMIPTGDFEVQVHCDSGQTFTGENFFRQEAYNITAGEGGGVDVVIVGGEMLELSE